VRAPFACLSFVLPTLRVWFTLLDLCSAEELDVGGAAYSDIIPIPNPPRPILNCAAAGTPSQGVAIVKIESASASADPRRRMRYKPYRAGKNVLLYNVFEK
jgi:hypothetical protein